MKKATAARMHNAEQRKAAELIERGWTCSPAPAEWTFSSRESGYKCTVPLWLTWEVRCDPISDDYLIDEISAADLWTRWIKRYPRDPDAEAVFGTGAVGIYWYVEGPSVFEFAPLQDLRAQSWKLTTDGFLKWFTRPEAADGSGSIRWGALPVIDKVWREDHLPHRHETKGGFIQEATGWKPGALQPYVNIDLLARASGLTRPSQA